MDHNNHAQTDRQNLRIGCAHLLVFIVLILGGIIMKRVYGHPEYMMLFHGPAAVFLVTGGLKISQKQRRRFAQVRID
jgi:archaellum biogenesis protein FlaJ (TadC family)